jgi:hypothetical protein
MRDKFKTNELLSMYPSRKAVTLASAAVLALGLLFTLSSCSGDLLQTEDPNRVTPDNFWENASDAEKGINAVYGTLPTVYGWGRMMGAILTIHRGDIVDVFPQANVYNTGTFNLTPSDGRVAEGWRNLWETVSRANNVLANVPDIEMDEERKAEIIGEAHFLRGLAYFYLQNMWGHIPLYTEPLLTLEGLAGEEQSPPEEVWESIESDFQAAQERLPESWSGSEVGRATWGAATAMLGKVHLYTSSPGLLDSGDWSAAAEEFQKIVDSGLYQLVDDYQHNFLEEYNNNAESIFEIQYEPSPNGSWGRSGNSSSPARGKGWEPDIAPPGYTSQQSVDINQWVFDLYMEEETVDGKVDPRAYATMLWDYDGAMVYQDTFDEAFSDENKDKVFVRKYLEFDRESSLSPGSWWYSGNNYRMVRYADVLLMLAEALNEANGPTSEVYDAINRVRARANIPALPSGMSREQMRQAIRDERVRELAIEGHRHLDLRRWGIMADRFLNNPQFRERAGMLFERNKNEILPIPQQDIDANPNLEQNPGYTGG